MKNAFTLIELMVVILIIAILAGLAFPLTSRLVENGRSTACMSNLRQIGLALTLYLNDHNSTMPTLVSARTSTSGTDAAIDNTLNAYINNTNTSSVFACPSDRQGLAKSTGTSYYWNNALNGQTLANLNLMGVPKFNSIPVILDKQGFHIYTQSKVNYLYADGHTANYLQFSVGQ